jgi:hypothetical protein
VVLQDRTVRLSAVARSRSASFGETRRSLGEGGKPDTTYCAKRGTGPAKAGHYFVAGATGVVAAGAGAVLGVAGGAAGRGAAAGGGADVPLSSDPLPRCPMIDSVSANSMKSTAAIDVAFVSSVAPDLAPKAA